MSITSEKSVNLRIITSAMAIVGVLAACHLADTPAPLALGSLLTVVVGSYVSYLRRNANNFWIKWGIAVGILVVLGFFVEEIAFRVRASIADAQVPLTNMLVALLGLHCFDLPKRRDLNVSALIGLALLCSAATLSRDLTFGLYLAVFIFFGVYMLYFDSVSRTTDGAAVLDGPGAQGSAVDDRLPALLAFVLVSTLSFALFALMPKFNLGLLHNIRVSMPVKLPFIEGERIANPLLSRTRRRDGSLEVNPIAYFGFDERLDLNYRGRLSEQIVMKVASPSGHLLRAMAFDTYDGHNWTMSSPRQTYDRVALRGAAIHLAPLPTLTLTGRAPTTELTQVFYLEMDSPNLVPTTPIPYLIYFPTNKVLVDGYGAVRSPVLMEKDMVYTVFSQVPQYSLEVLRSLPLAEQRSIRRLRRGHPTWYTLPKSLPSDVSALAQRIGGGSGNWFVKAERINNFLRTNYKYDLNIPPTAPETDVVSEFLFKRHRGYCEHFASAFVIMCRTQGIPARLVTGFSPGAYNPFTGLWEIRMKDAHAWAEIYMPRWGWISFDPTPDGVPPAFSGYQTQSPTAYIVEALGRWLDKLSHQPQVGDALALISSALAPLAEKLSWLAFFMSSSWQLLAISMFVIAGAIVAIKTLLVPSFPRLRAEDASDKSEPRRQKAKDEYLLVCRYLSQLGLRRGPHETAKDFAGRVKKSLSAEFDGILPLLVDSFIAEYAQQRFGVTKKSSQLPIISDRIRQEVKVVCKNKRKAKRNLLQRD